MSIRGELAKRNQIRDSFVGTFSRFGKKHGKNSGDTVLLLDIYRAKRLGDSSFSIVKKIITDHLWFNLTEGFRQVDLKEGDRVLFDARIKEYRKGSIKRGIPVVIDYKLSHPSKVQPVGPHPSIQCKNN